MWFKTYEEYKEMCRALEEANYLARQKQKDKKQNTL